jgi:YHS domain-containing protein
MRLKNICTVLLIVFAFSIGTSLAADTIANEQKTCPVMGGKINKDIYADYEGKRVYFCCDACISTFKKDPAKYVTKIEGEGVVLKTVSTGDAHHEHEHDHGKKPGADK